MAVKIRLTRRGRKKLAIFDVIVADARAPRDGRFIEKIGTYNPNSNPASININDEKAFQWVMKGAQPSETVKAMLSYNGILFKKHLQIGVIKGALTQEQADAKFQEWKEKKEAKIAGKVENLTKKKADELKARKEAETKVKEARAEALRKKQQAANPVPVEEEESAKEEVTEEVNAEAATTEEVSTEAAKTEEVAETAKSEANIEAATTEAPAEEIKAETSEDEVTAKAKPTEVAAEETASEEKENEKTEEPKENS